MFSSGGRFRHHRHRQPLNVLAQTVRDWDAVIIGVRAGVAPGAAFAPLSWGEKTALLTRMTDPLRARYDALPYRHGAVPESHPARLGAIVRLLGMEAAAPDGCRVLELGCGEGMNLLPLAERFARSHFTGVDFSAAQIATAEDARAGAGLDNAQLVCADLREFEVEPGAFDYVIAHGVYSWVTDEVKDRLLALIVRALAPTGVGYVSYSTQPGGGLTGSLRATILASLGPAPNVARTGEMLHALAAGFARQPGPHAALMRELLGDMLATPAATLLHGDLAAVNDPVAFLDFVAHATHHGLRFLAEAQFSSMPCEHLPEAARTPLAAFTADPLHAQQFLDLLGNRRFRNSLLVRADAPPAREPDPSVIRDCALALHMFPPDGRIVLAPEVPLRLTGRHDFAMDVVKPAQKAFFAALCEAAPARITFEAALRRAGELLAAGGNAEPLEPERLAAGMLKLFTVDQIDLALAGAGEWLRTAPNPAPTPLMRHQARHGLPVVNRWHENVELSEAQRRGLVGDSVPVDEAALVRTGLAV